MTDSFFSAMQQKAHTFSKGQRLLAKYITEFYDKAAFMTASKLGKSVGVSEATVVRFAAQLGYDGYPSMQKAMQEAVLSRLTSAQKTEPANDCASDENGIGFILRSDAEKLRKTAEMVDKEAFNAAVNAILSAQNIYILGCKASAPLASFLGYYMNFMFPNVHVVTDSTTSEVLEKLVRIDANDVVIEFSFPPYSTSTAKVAQYCRTTGATVIGCTDSHFSPLGQHCDHVLLAKSEMYSLVGSLVAPLSLINAIIVALASKREQTLSKTFDVLKNIWEEYSVYEKRVDNK